MIIDTYCLVFTLRLIVRLTKINFSIARLIAIKNFNRTAVLVMTIARGGLKIKFKGESRICAYCGKVWNVGLRLQREMSLFLGICQLPITHSVGFVDGSLDVENISNRSSVWA